MFSFVFLWQEKRQIMDDEKIIHRRNRENNSSVCVWCKFIILLTLLRNGKRRFLSRKIKYCNRCSTLKNVNIFYITIHAFSYKIRCILPFYYRRNDKTSSMTIPKFRTSLNFVKNSSEEFCRELRREACKLEKYYCATCTRIFRSENLDENSIRSSRKTRKYDFKNSRGRRRAWQTELLQADYMGL